MNPDRCCVRLLRQLPPRTIPSLLLQALLRTLEAEKQFASTAGRGAAPDERVLNLYEKSQCAARERTARTEGPEGSAVWKSVDTALQD